MQRTFGLRLLAWRPLAHKQPHAVEEDLVRFARSTIGEGLAESVGQRTGPLAFGGLNFVVELLSSGAEKGHLRGLSAGSALFFQKGVCVDDQFCRLQAVFGHDHIGASRRAHAAQPRTRVAGIEEGQEVAPFAQFFADFLQHASEFFIANEVLAFVDPFLVIEGRVVGYDGLVESVELVAVVVPHLLPVPGEVENGQAALSCLAEQVLFQCPQDACPGRVGIL